MQSNNEFEIDQVTQASGEDSDSNNSPVSVSQTPEQMMVGIITDIAKESIKCFTDYQKCKEQEKTERIRIRGQLKAILRKIDADKEMFIHVVNSQFEEREQLYKRMDKMIELALKLEDIETLKYCYEYNMIIYQGAANPLEKLSGPVDLAHLISKNE